MSFTRLSGDSQKLLFELIQADDPAQILCKRFDNATQQEDDELCGILRELRERGYLDIKWADNRPYYVVFNNSVRTYMKQSSEHKMPGTVDPCHKKEVKSIIFISHRTIDKPVADMLVDFFSAVGIPREAIFCSSLPGNDVKERISNEVKTALKNSVANIAILSSDYYQSAYCLNEAGILWYEDTTVIPIALPEINENNMYGFLNGDYKLRRLDSDTDIAYIYDAVEEAVFAPRAKAVVYSNESIKLKQRYSDFLKNRNTKKYAPNVLTSVSNLEITTDDERIALYCLLQKNVRKLPRAAFVRWMNENEIHNVDVNNAFDLLSSIKGGEVKSGTLELGIEAFRKYSANATALCEELKPYVEQHRKIAKEDFLSLWRSGCFDAETKLFLAYIVDEKECSFGDRGQEEGQIQSIRQWEGKNNLTPTLSSSYSHCLQILIRCNLVYESDWTSYGNAREYSLYPSLARLFFNCPREINEELKNVKEEYQQEEFPF